MICDNREDEREREKGQKLEKMEEKRNRMRDRERDNSKLGLTSWGGARKRREAYIKRKK